MDYGVKPDWDRALEAKVMEGQRVVYVDYDAYFPCTETLRNEWAGRLAIKRGLEFGVQTHTIPQFNALWDKWHEHLDFTLLSIHQVGDAEFWTGEFQEGRTQEEYNRAYYQELYDVATSFEHWSVLAHLDLIKRYDPADILGFPANRDLAAATLEHVISQPKYQHPAFPQLSSWTALPALSWTAKESGSSEAAVITFMGHSHYPDQVGGSQPRWATSQPACASSPIRMPL